MHSPAIDIELNGCNVLCVYIPAGEFIMGSDCGFPLELPPHRVSIIRQFYLTKFLVTQHVYESVTGHNPSEFKNESTLPVEGVSWNDAKAFCRRASSFTRRSVRLPTEAEWEYACRAGTTTEYFFGETAANIGDYAWYDINSRDRTHPVGTKLPNPWGLHDMIGSVWEWCEDVWHSDYANAPSDGSSWLAQEDRQPRRSLRGGAWDMDAFRCRSAYRSYDGKELATSRFGFRVAIDIQ